MLRETENSTRERVLAFWKIIPKYKRKNGDNVWCLSGVVIEDNTPDFEDIKFSGIRITNTSPIIRCEGNIVYTASGSKYRLTEIAVDKWLDPDGNKIDLSCFVSPSYWNTWISGNNWLTD